MTRSSSPSSSPPELADVANLQMRASLPASVASDPGLSSEVIQIGEHDYFVFTDTLRCRHCVKQKKPECLVRVDGYTLLLRWCATGAETRRPNGSSCTRCNKSHSPFCRSNCIDMILGPNWEPARSIAGKRGRDSMQESQEKRKKGNDGNAVASSSRRNLTPDDYIPVIRQASSSPAAEVASSPPPPNLSAISINTAPTSLPVTSESNDLLRMIVEKLDLIVNKIDAQTTLLCEVLTDTTDNQWMKVEEI